MDNFKSIYKQSSRPAHDFTILPRSIFIIYNFQVYLFSRYTMSDHTSSKIISESDNNSTSNIVVEPNSLKDNVTTKTESDNTEEGTSTFKRNDEWFWNTDSEQIFAQDGKTIMAVGHASVKSVVPLEL